MSIAHETLTTNNHYGVRSGTKSILRFRGLGNTSLLQKLFFKSLSVVFVASVPCLQVVASLFSSYCFLQGTTGFSLWCRYGLMSSLHHFYVFVSLDLPFVDCATYLTAVSQHLKNKMATARWKGRKKRCPSLVCSFHHPATWRAMFLQQSLK